MKIKSKLAPLTRRLVSLPVAKELYESSLAATGLALSVAQDVLGHYEDKVETEYERVCNEQSVLQEEPPAQTT